MFAGLDLTGQLDENTVANILTPRCTVKDLLKEFNKDARIENFNLRSKWEKKTLTWRVTKFPSNDVSDELVNRTMEMAFSLWSTYADLTFIQVRHV